MKKVLPLLLFVLLAFAGCQRGPATYQITDNPREIAINAEKFVNQVEKLSKHYTTEDWDAAFDQFIMMSKNYFEFGRAMTQDEQMKYDNARLRFMAAIDANGTEDLTIRVKEAYANIMGE